LLDLEPDAVVVCLPHHLHREAGVAAAEAGCHLLMEKPLAHTMADARAIVAACQRHDVRLAVSFVHRYRAELQRAREIIAAGELGTLHMVYDVFGMKGGAHIPGWVWHKQYSGGGILMYSGIHRLDWQAWLVDSPIVEVYARQVGYEAGTDTESSLAVNATFASGCLGVLIGNQPPYLVTPVTRATEVYGSRGALSLRTNEYLTFSDDQRAYRVEVSRDDPFLAQAADFVAAIREGREPWINGAAGLRTQAVIEAIYRSAREGHPVAVEQVS
jgi:predicted dehydrogenase